MTNLKLQIPLTKSYTNDTDEYHLAFSISTTEQNTYGNIISEKTGVSNVSPQTRDLMEEVVTKTARVAGEKIGERVSVSAGKIARYEEKPVNETHINLAIKLLGRRFEIDNQRTDKKAFREELSRKLDIADTKEGLAKAEYLKEIIADFKRLIRLSDLETVAELKQVVSDLEKEVEELEK